ncbi:MAG: PilZ domain-containing protein [Candidatus Omnitrophota bacterium]
MTGWDGLNRRKFPRANYPCLIIIRHNHAGPEAMLTHTENLGIGGVCVILKRSLKLFTTVELELDLLDTNLHIKCEGKVVWSVQRKNPEEKKPSFYDTGIEFSSINAKDAQRIIDVVARLVKLGFETPPT